MAEPSSIPHPTAGALPTPPSAGESRIIKKRNRVPVSCGPCRTRRSKCDRNHPCSSCDKRGESHLCNYAKAAEKHPRISEVDGRRQTTYGAQDRLQQLESLLMQLVNKHENAPPAYQDASTASPSFPDTGYSTAVPESSQPHWSAILNGIQELRSAMQHEEASPEPPDGVLDLEDRPVLLAAARPSSLASILPEYLPPREECDRRLAKYFRTPYIAIPLVHSISFEAQYRQFWDSPSRADPVWCALLFALLSLSAHISNVTGVSPSESHPTDRFIHASAACLNLAGYSRPREHLIAALLLLAQSIYMQNYDPSREVGLILSIVTRLAFQSNLHREPLESSSLSIFEVEMNRRLWVMVRHFDLQCACQFGVPSAIPYNSYDIGEPRNLVDTDISPDMTALPPSRPDSEPTPVTSFLIKHRLMNVFSEIYFHACAARDALSDADVQRMDDEIRKQRDNIPGPYRSRPVESSFTTEQHVIMARITCELLAQKSICLLHRKRMARGNAESRTACMDAAATIVEKMIDFVESLKPGAPLEGQAWMISSTNVNDFLLGSMILCAGLYLEDKGKKSTKDKNKAKKDDQAQLIIKAKQLCLELGVKSKGAQRVADALGVSLGKMGLEKDENVDPSLSTSATQQATSPSMLTPMSAQQQYGVGGMPSNMSVTSPTPFNMPMSMSMSNDAMSSLAAAAAQLSPEGGFDATLNKQGLTQQNYGGPGYSWVSMGTSAQDNQHQYPGNYQGQPQMPPPVQVQPTPNPFEQLFGKFGEGQEASMAGVGEGQRGDIDWGAFDQFITAGDLTLWDSNV